MLERFTDDARATVLATQELCRRLGSEKVEPVHLLLALCQPQSSVRDLLAEHGLTDATVDAALRREGHAPDRRVGTRGDEDADVLRSLGIDLDAVRRAVESAFGEGALDEPAVEHGQARGRVRIGRSRTRFGRPARKVLELAVREAVRQRSRSIGSHHIALGVLRVDDAHVRRLLSRLGVDPSALRTDLEGPTRRSA